MTVEVKVGTTSGRMSCGVSAPAQRVEEKGVYKEYFGDMWDYARHSGPDAVCITTNGFIKKNGEAVMGRGCAKQAAKRNPSLPKVLGRLLKEGGNHVWILNMGRQKMVSVPVKHHWYEKADTELIERSLIELVYLTTANQWKNVLLPRPGCGNGQLSWSRDVKKLCDKYLDERFTVVDYG